MQMPFGAPARRPLGASLLRRLVLTGGSIMADMVKSFPAGEGGERMPGPAGYRPDVKESASNVAGQAKEMVSGQVARGAERSAQEISSVARALRQTKEELGDNFAAPLVDKAADKLEGLSRFLRTAEPKQVVWEVESFARREPLVFLGGAFVLGLLGARFLKSSRHHGSEWAGSGWQDESWGNTGPRGAGERAGTGAPDIGATAPDPRGDYPPNSPPGGPYPGSGMSTVDRQDRERRAAR
jgi:hypothetical protein